LLTSLALRSLGLSTLVLCLIAPAAVAETLTFTPEADAYVDRSTPGTSYGDGYALVVDGRSRAHAYLRFDVRVPGDRPIVAAKLRLYQADTSASGGHVARVRARAWDEAMTWRTRPAINGRYAGRFGRVRPERWYELDVSRLLRRSRRISFGLWTNKVDGVKWRSRESSFAPQLVVEAKGRPPADGLTTIATSTFGSSDVTDYPSQHRLAKTATGRLLTVFGRHKSGVQLAWRDHRGGWETRTRGFTATGRLSAGTGTGDWPASIAVAADGRGDEHAWVVFAGRNSGVPGPLTLVRVSELDDPAGPSVGRPATLDPEHGAWRPDLAFERAPDGTFRGVVLWGRRGDEGGFETPVGWFTDVESDSPAMTAVTVLQASASGQRVGTLEPSPPGMRIAVRGPDGRAGVFAHPAGAPLTAWEGPGGSLPLVEWALSTPGMPTLFPAAAAFADGGLVLASESDSGDQTVSVQRFSPDGEPLPVELALTGYVDPTVATDGNRIWLLAVRVSDGYVISRQFTPGDGWTTSDRVEIGREGGGDHRSISPIRQVDSRLRFIVRGPLGGSGDSAAAVLGFQRKLAP